VANRGRTIEQIRDGKAKPSQQLADEQKVVDEKALGPGAPSAGGDARPFGPAVLHLP
jgi:hypothetical protein